MRIGAALPCTVDGVAGDRRQKNDITETNILGSDLNIFFEKKDVVISHRSGAHV